jgi:hypothetical protein
MRLTFIFIFLLSAAAIYSQKISERPIPVGHSHNDYNKRKPLWGALEHGMTSIEIDVFAHKGELKVAHVGLFLNTRKNIQKMYLKPLSEILAKRKWIYKNHQEPLVLMIDFKTDSEETLQLLLRDIEPLKDLFTYYHQGEVHKKPLQLVISGRGFSYNQISHLDTVYVFLDGSVSHCEENFPQQLIPRGSANYGRHFNWNGKNQFPDDEKNKLIKLVTNAQECNKKLRFYAMRHNENLWTEFLNAGAGWINIDKAARFADFYWNKYLPMQTTSTQNN